MQEDPDHIGIIPRAIVHVFQVRLLSKVVWLKETVWRITFPLIAIIISGNAGPLI